MVLEAKNSLGVLSIARITIAKDDVMQPIGHDAFCIHELSDGLQDSFEVVLFGLATHYYVEIFVNILGAVTRTVHVEPVLIGIEPNSVSPSVTGQIWSRLRTILDNTAVRI